MGRHARKILRRRDAAQRKLETPNIYLKLRQNGCFNRLDDQKITFANVSIWSSLWSCVRLSIVFRR
jgi:hypothetical protein